MPRRVTQSAPAVAAGDDTALELSKVATIVAANDPQSNLIALLQRAQAEFGYLPEPVVQEIARLGGVPASRIYGVITFYSQFTTEPSGRNKICVCHGTACHVAGASRITEAISQELGVDDGGTTADMNFTLDSVACMGACSQAPVMRINDETYGHLAPDTARKVIRELLASLGMDPADLADATTRGGNDE